MNGGKRLESEIVLSRLASHSHQPSFISEMHWREVEAMEGREPPGSTWSSFFILDYKSIIFYSYLLVFILFLFSI